MINFFRKIRQNLLTDYKVGKYLLYAFGEILLVVIGILIALQINNWNEGHKTLQVKKEYLQGIKSDLSQDILFLNGVIDSHKYRMAQIKAQDPTIKILSPEETGQLPNADPIDDITYFFKADRRFRSKVGSYKSLMSEGKSGIIDNRVLFNSIQSYYEQEIMSSEVIGQEMWNKNIRIGEKYAFEIKNEDFGSPVIITNKYMLADLSQSFDLTNFYVMHANSIMVDIKDLIQSIERELATLD